ncbi:sensor histidine kinase [Amycolatopsis regifaucium]|uniref:Histidine kinase n=1 Tax=Amycolatopsis regifaucium TaxID=546365 RepID=A0A154MMA2_9PSEU|nr:sensor histidine kinase [Amycolatopsis regifaucium]KZB85504.1 histidine kinase [Amycolatopsis regifaucium]OKA08982.1 two-component sensor histidine kinase [Amycolatopsis regifaucium]SFJ38029.1 two-component system, NarL family, sensor histidine kinase DesK [Amycolatopsis regifaucium]
MNDYPGRVKTGLNSRENWWSDMPPRVGRGPSPGRWSLLGTAFVLPLLIPAGHKLLVSDHVWQELLVVVLLIAYAACYVLFPLILRPSQRRVTYLFSALMLLIGLTLTFLSDNNPYVLIYATAVLAFTLPPAWALMLDGGALLLVLALQLLAGRDDFGDLIAVVSITAAMFFMASLVRAVRKLEAANREIATLAVADERERLARDLHDILGHSLTTITVKAGLARRMLESGMDDGRALEEIREVEGLTRSALSDIRATVSEYREVSLSAELAGARAALRAAEIDADLPHAVDNVEPGLQRTFGYVLREAVTNVLRHSEAKRVKVRFGERWLEVEDDGQAVEAPAGNGLHGLTERLDAVGGTLEASPRPEGGWLVRAEVPAAAVASGARASFTETAGECA